MSVLCSGLYLIGAAILILIVHRVTRRRNGYRTTVSVFVHLVFAGCGLLIQPGLGGIAFAVLALFLYYYLIYLSALAIIPTSPGDPQRWKRFSILFRYMWGFAVPVRIPRKRTSKNVRDVISGNQRNAFGFKGLLCLHANQVAGLTTGTHFTRVVGPGVVFTRRFEKVFENGVMDLRTQIRTAWVDVISQEGVKYQALMLVVFRINPDLSYYHQELKRICPGQECRQRLRAHCREYQESGLPYVNLRARDALHMTGKKIFRFQDRETALSWDNMVVDQAQEVARQVLANRALSSLWEVQEAERDSAEVHSASRGEEEGGSTLIPAKEVIAKEMRDRLAEMLLAYGVKVITCRAVKFDFSDSGDVTNDQIAEQQVQTWKAKWDRDTQRRIADGEAEAIRLQQEARIYARSLLLTSLADGMKEVEKSGSDSAKFVIGMGFLSALEDLLRREPKKEEDTREKKSSLSKIRRNYLRDFRSQEK
jgi:hypothetical protein